MITLHWFLLTLGFGFAWFLGFCNGAVLENYLIRRMGLINA